jgi:hypothetical protein
MLLPEFIAIDQPELIVWSDSGTNFRCKEFVNFCTNYLARQNKSVTLNYLGERHGKNMRDAHFSVVSRAFKYATHKNQKGLNSAQEVVDALNSSYIYLNEEKIEQNKKFSTSIAVYYNPANEHIERNERDIADFSCYYHFKTIRENVRPQESRNRKKNANEIVGNIEYRLYSAIFSDGTIFMPVESQIVEYTQNFYLNEEDREKYLVNNKIKELEFEEVQRKIKKIDKKRDDIEIIFRNYHSGLQPQVAQAQLVQPQVAQAQFVQPQVAQA